MDMSSDMSNWFVMFHSPAHLARTDSLPFYQRKTWKRMRVKYEQRTQLTVRKWRLSGGLQ